MRRTAVRSLRAQVILDRMRYTTLDLRRLDRSEDGGRSGGLYRCTGSLVEESFIGHDPGLIKVGLQQCRRSLSVGSPVPPPESGFAHRSLGPDRVVGAFSAPFGGWSID